MPNDPSDTVVDTSILLKGAPIWEKHTRERDRVHHFFGLTYAAYLVLPRSVMKSMPDEWQNKFVDLIEELNESYSELFDEAGIDEYMVKAKKNGKFCKDVFMEYDRGRRYIPLKHK